MFAGIVNGPGGLVYRRPMTDENTARTGVTAADGRSIANVDWTRLEGVLAVGALLTSFIWFLGMPTGMAIGVGFGTVLLLDFVRSLIFDSSLPDQSRLSAGEINRQ